MADPLEAYNREQNRRNIPLTRGQEIAGGIGSALESIQDVLPPAGMNAFTYYPMKMAESMSDYFQSPSSVVKDLQSGKIPESEIPLGVDLVDIFGDTDPTLGIPDFVPDDYEAGEIFKFDPTGEGKTKGMPETKAEREAREAREISEQFGDIEFDITNKIDAQLAENAEKKRAQRAEDFRQQEAQIAEGQGGLKSMTVAESEAVTEQMFASAMQDYIEQARGTGPDIKDPKSLDEYKKEFADATGIDISGKPDKSQALMAFGLALMQNKAGGKGITGMLGAIGEAGQAAMPALEKARQQARQDGIAAGKFALEMRSADQAKAAAAKEKAMERSNYFVVPRSDDVKGFLAGIGEGRGRLESLSKYELNKLQENPEFSQKFDILPAATWATVVEEAMKTPEAKDLYRDTPTSIPLIKGIDDDLFKIRIYDPDPNTNRGGQPIMAGDGQQQYEALARMARDNQKAKEKFIELGILNEGTNIFRYTVDSLNSLASAFNVSFSENEPESMKMKRILEAMAAKQAPAILGESGKTISDGDRERVAAIVGTITPTTDPRVLSAKLQSLFNDIVLGAEADISGALSTLNRYTGRNIGVGLDGPLSDEEASELAGYEGE
jgi:hypothetical protein